MTETPPVRPHTSMVRVTTVASEKTSDRMRDVTSKASPGVTDLKYPVLYLFANDWWQTANNNSGGVRLSIERITAVEGSAPLWTLQAQAGKGWIRAESAQVA